MDAVMSFKKILFSWDELCFWQGPSALRLFGDLTIKGMHFVTRLKDGGIRGLL